MLEEEIEAEAEAEAGGTDLCWALTCTTFWIRKNKALNTLKSESKKKKKSTEWSE